MCLLAVSFPIIYAIWQKLKPSALSYGRQFRLEISRILRPPIGATIVLANRNMQKLHLHYRYIVNVFYIYYIFISIYFLMNICDMFLKVVFCSKSCLTYHAFVWFLSLMNWFNMFHQMVLSWKTVITNWTCVWFSPLMSWI